MIINHNASAHVARRHLADSARGWEVAAERVASGQRINRAGDDATGFAISERMKMRVRGLDRAMRNSMDGISFIQVAEGNLSTVTDILQRVRELAVQSANGIYGEEDRKLIQVEFSQLVNELDRVVLTAEFNKNKLLDGRYSAQNGKEQMFFHVGPDQDQNNNQRIRAYIDSMGSQALGLKADPTTKKSLATVSSANQMIAEVDEALEKISSQRANLGAIHNGLEKNVRGLENTMMDTQDAVSRIRDADIAEEMIEMTKNQVLLQSSTAVLAQANFMPQIVLQLLG